MADFLCWCETEWEGIEDALAHPEDGTSVLGCLDAEHAAAEYRDGDGDDYDLPDEVAIYVQQIEPREPVAYVGEPVIVDVVREVVHRYSGTIRKPGGARG